MTTSGRIGPGPVAVRTVRSVICLLNDWFPVVDLSRRTIYLRARSWLFAGRLEVVAKRTQRDTGVADRAAGENRPLDADVWADAALLELAAHGIDRVRVEVLAKRLAVTKGSFYWHFKDRDTLLSTMLDRWRRRATLALIERLDRGGGPAIDRLRELLHLPMLKERSAQAAEVELAIRLWGRTDPRARAALEEVDELRLRYLSQLLVQSGAEPETARARAILAYSYQRVAPTLIPADAAELMRQCEELLTGVSRS